MVLSRARIELMEVGGVETCSLGEWVVEVREVKSGVIYRRFRGSEIVKNLFIASKSKYLEIYPEAPMIYGLKTADCILVRLSAPLVVLPYSRVEVELSVPLDAVVKVKDRVIDSFPLGPHKYALYGSPERGNLCRYVVAGDASRVLAGRFTLKVQSKFGKTAVLRKFLIPESSWSVYVDREGKFFLDTISITIANERMATIFVTPPKSYGYGMLELVSYGKRGTYFMALGY